MAVRFFKDYKSLVDLYGQLGTLLEQESTHFGIPLAQTKWIGDHDAHMANIGVLLESGLATRIDFDGALSGRGVSFDFDSEQEGVFYERYTNIREEFARESRRLASLRYHESPQFDQLLNKVIDHYQANAVYQLTAEERAKIFADIKECFTISSISIQLIAELADLNNLVKSKGFTLKRTAHRQEAYRIIKNLDTLFKRYGEDRNFVSCVYGGIHKINQTVKDKKLFEDLESYMRDQGFTEILDGYHNRYSKALTEQKQKEEINRRDILRLEKEFKLPFNQHTMPLWTLANTLNVKMVLHFLNTNNPQYIKCVARYADLRMFSIAFIQVNATTSKLVVDIVVNDKALPPQVKIAVLKSLFHTIKCYQLFMLQVINHEITYSNL